MFFYYTWKRLQKVNICILLIAHIFRIKIFTLFLTLVSQFSKTFRVDNRLTNGYIKIKSKSHTRNIDGLSCLFFYYFNKLKSFWIFLRIVHCSLSTRYFIRLLNFFPINMFKKIQETFFVILFHFVVTP